MSDTRSESSGSSGLFVGGLLVGAMIGTVTGLLIAPKAGRETRQLLKKSADALPELAEDLSSSMQLQADRLSGSALRNWDDTLSRLREAITVGLEASQRRRQELEQVEPPIAAEPHPPVHDSGTK
jgi:gas vesicle protein